MIAASLVWALSFGIIKTSLAGLEPSFVGWARLALALLVFAPLIRARGLGWRLVLALLAIGAVEYGLMYSFYLAAFSRLDAHHVALFTILTPLYVTLWADLRGRRVDWFALAMAAVAVAGAAVIRYEGREVRALMIGFGLVQAANLCFAIGQVEYRRLRREGVLPAGSADKHLQGLLFTGGLAVATAHTSAASGWGRSIAAIDREAAAALLFLGVVASGLGFFAWSRGSAMVSAGALAALNNLKIPLAVAASLWVFGESGDPRRLWIGGGLMVAATAAAELRATRARASRPRERL